MRALGFSTPHSIDHPEAIQEYDLSTPSPQAGEVLVRVHACAINPIDAKLRAKGHQVSEPNILGWDAAGEIVALGEGVRNFSLGDLVYYAGQLERQGCNAEFHCVSANLVALMPLTLNCAEAAALPLTAITAWELLFESMSIAAGNVRANVGKSILVINGAGGVGSMVIQLAKWSGLHVVATASRPKSNIWCRQMGADSVIDWRQGIAHACIHAGFEQFDYIVCLTDADFYWQDMATLIRPFGAIGLITSAQQPMNINLFKNKSARLCWEFMFCRASLENEQRKQQAILAEIGALIDIGVCQTTLNLSLEGLTADNLRQAHAMMESGHAIGKCVIDFTQDKTAPIQA